MKLLILILLTIITFSEACPMANGMPQFKEKCAKFRPSALPLGLRLKEIKSNRKLPTDSIANRFGPALPFAEYEDVFAMCSAKFEGSDEDRGFLLFPYFRYETENLILLTIYNRGVADGVKDEYYLAVYDKSGILKSALKIGLYSKDDIGSSSVETEIDTLLKVEKNSKEYVFIGNSESCVKRQTNYYQIDPVSGEIGNRMKKKKKK